MRPVITAQPKYTGRIDLPILAPTWLGVCDIICTVSYCLKAQLFMHATGKDRHQELGHEFRCSLSISMDKLFPKKEIIRLFVDVLFVSLP